MTSNRDCQRQRLYDAEDGVCRMFERANSVEATHGPVGRQVQIHGSSVVLPVERKFGDLAGVQRYCDQVLALPSVRAAFAQAAYPITCRERQSAHRAHYEVLGAVIAIPASKRGGRFTMRELYVLHEIAHHLTPDDPGHGPAFAAAYVELAEIVLGPETAFVLRAALLDGGVRIG